VKYYLVNISHEMPKEQKCFCEIVCLVKWDENSISVNSEVQSERDSSGPNYT